ncbi:MAG: KGK domain-containing protein [Planktothrix sp.]
MSDLVDLKNCEDYEVMLFENHICLVERLKQDLEYALKESAQTIINSLVNKQSNKSFFVMIDNSRHDKQWFEEGKECKLLKFGTKEWQPGTLKMKVTLEFCPEKPEEEIDDLVKSLDDICQELNQENNS